MKNLILFFVALTVIISKSQAQTVTDIDGNVYNTVLIGTQEWLQENLKTTKYSNGELIGTTTPATFDIRPENTPKYQWAYEGNNNKVDTFGRLYTWYATTDSRGICPTGWHVPADAEWTTLTTFLGGTSVAGGKMKATGNSDNGSGLWSYPNSYATNESNFTALPAGYREDDGTFKEIASNCYLWSSTELYQTSAWRRRLDYDFGGVSAGVEFKKSGLSVRCVKDSTTQINDINFYEKINIFPNPANNYVTIEASLKTAPIAVGIEIMNLSGQLLKSITANEAHVTIDISNMAAGMYFVKVITENEISVRKFIKK